MPEAGSESTICVFSRAQSLSPMLLDRWISLLEGTITADLAGFLCNGRVPSRRCGIRVFSGLSFQSPRSFNHAKLISLLGPFEADSHTESSVIAELVDKFATAAQPVTYFQGHWSLGRLSSLIRVARYVKPSAGSLHRIPIGRICSGKPAGTADRAATIRISYPIQS